MTSIYSSMEAAIGKLRSDCKGQEAVKLAQAHLTNRVVPPRGRPHPIVIIEGADGTGKSTLVQGLLGRLGQRATPLKTPPKELAHLRQHFDAQEDVQLRRAFYLLANYVCAAQIHTEAAAGPVVVDRFWPSTVCYGIAHDFKANPEDVRELLEMPRDLMELLPNGHPITALCLELSEKERAHRVRARASSLADIEITREEEELERSQAHRLRLCAAYRSVRFAGEPLTICDASGAPQDVLQRALSFIESAMQEHLRLEPRSVNWHMTRRCNYQCLFCFHTNTSSFFLPQDEPNGMAETKRCFKRLADAGMKKLNFSGGEPFLYPKQLGELCKFCKEELDLESVSIVSNGSKIKRQWLEKYGAYVDILAVSCDSFVEATNIATGRGKGMHIAQLEQVKAWCDEFDVPFKLNSVINTNNVDEDMTEAIMRLNPMRWKVFQCLLLEGENVGAEALRNAAPLVISDQQFEDFVQRHKSKGITCIVPENNEAMRDSYLILDEKLCFLNCTGNSKAPSKSIRDVSVKCALREAGFDSDMFRKRGGIYAWSRSAAALPQSSRDIEDAPGSVAGGGADAKGANPTSTTVRPGEDPKRSRLLTAFGVAGASLGLLVALRVLQQRRRS